MLIKYRYAYDSNNQIIDVTKLHRQNLRSEEVFKCLGCNNILIPILGEKRQKHFRHKIDIDCSPETYLHKLAKIRFYEVYTNCIQQNKPFLITINQKKICNHYQQEFLFTCKYDKSLQTFDLTKYFSQISLEKKEDSFIPDLLLTSEKGDKLFIEIAVTHRVNQKKEKSEYRIIELDIAKEEDLTIIENPNLEQGEKVRFFNFKNQIIKDFCQGKCCKKFEPYSDCLVKYNYFVVFNNGKSAILNTDLDDINRLHTNRKIKHGEFINFSRYKLHRKNQYIKLVIESYLNNDGIKNCFLCRYHGDSYYSDQPIFCKFLKKNCSSNEAANCQYYRPDTKVFPSHY